MHEVSNLRLLNKRLPIDQPVLDGKSVMPTLNCDRLTGTFIPFCLVLKNGEERARQDDIFPLYNVMRCLDPNMLLGRAGKGYVFIGQQCNSRMLMQASYRQMRCHAPLDGLLAVGVIDAYTMGL